MHPGGKGDPIHHRLSLERTTDGWARLDTQSIFREMVAQELRAGRLSRAGRRRVVQYAAQLGLSAVQAGKLIGECRDAALRSDNPHERRHALRLARETAPPKRMPIKAALAIAGIMIVELLLIAWVL